MAIVQAADLHWSPPPHCPRCGDGVLPAGQGEPFATDAQARIYCRKHGGEVEPTYPDELASYRAWRLRREEAIRTLDEAVAEPTAVAANARLPLADWGRRPGIVLDTGALIELQVWSSTNPTVKRVRDAWSADQAVLVPAPVVTEWLVAAQQQNLKIVEDAIALGLVTIGESLARNAAYGLQRAAHPACSACKVRGGPSVVDAIVMALANDGGDLVLTSDPTDMAALQSTFPRARYLKV